MEDLKKNEDIKRPWAFLQAELKTESLDLCFLCMYVSVCVCSRCTVMQGTCQSNRGETAESAVVLRSVG